MANMSERELLAIVNDSQREAVNWNGEFMRENEKFLGAYLTLPRGDEVADQSQVISNDVADVVESDMPSLVRIFLGQEDVMEFEPGTSSEADTLEAEEKTQYVNWIIKHQKNSFKIIHDWIKDAEIQKMGVLKYEYVETKETKIEEYDGMSDEELALLVQDISSEADKDTKIKIIEQNQDDGENYIRIKITKKRKEFVIRGIPTEDFIITRNAESKDDADLVGDRTKMSRGELIALGFDEDLVKSLPATNDNESDQDFTNLKSIRFRDQGGSDIDSDINHEMSQEIEVFNLYVKVDFDGDGITERRHIIKAGNKILQNEQFDIAPYAVISSILMPHKAIGRSRTEVSMQTQDIKTVLYRQLLDNIYRVNNGRVVVNDEQTNIDDLLTIRPNGIVRTNGDPRQAVAQLETPYIGQQALQVIQYVDAVRAQTTGQLLANQGLDADNFHKETATRFEGVEKAGSAKVELVARVIAETGYRELFDGLAWMVSHYQDDEKEIMVLGKPVTVDPRRWRHDHFLTSNVGLAAGDDEQQLQNMSSLLIMHQQLAQAGSPLTDSQKQFNLLEKVAKVMGLQRPHEIFNNPEVPQELLLAQNEQLQQQVQLLTQQVQNNPLAEAEQIKAEAGLIQAQAKQQLDVAKLIEEQRQFNIDAEQKQQKLNDDIAAKLTELELKYSGQETNNPDVPGSLV